MLKKGDIVIYESTVYPGATEEDCAPLLEMVSDLKLNVDFYLGYSPERINPGDKLHRVATIKKVTSGSTPKVAELIDQLYGQIITTGTHKAPSIKVAEAAKVIENTQRDLNIALINKLAIIFNRMGIDTEAVLQAAGTKWIFPAVPSRPGRRPLHRGRSLLPHAQGDGDRLPPGNHPGRQASQRQHGRLRGVATHQSHDQAPHPCRRRAHSDHGVHLQGELPGFAQHEGCRHCS